MIEYIRTTREFPRQRGVFDVSFRIEKGDWAALVGPAGAGKSTLLRMVYAAEKPDSGEVKVSNYRISKISPREEPTLRRMLGVVDQDLSLLVDRTVLKNVTIVGEVLGWSIRKSEREALSVLNQVGLYAHLDSYPTSLSYGERRRLAIARALIAQPFVIIADEPLGNLDQETARGIVELLAKIHARGTTLLIATHRLELFAGHPLKVVRIESGRISK